MTDERPPPAFEEMPSEELYVVGQDLPPAGEVHDRVVAVASALTAIGGLVFGVGLVTGASRTVYASGLALALLALAVGFHRYFRSEYPEIYALEPRPGREEEESAETKPLTDVRQVRRRGFLGWLLAAGAAVLGLSLAAPVASLGPTPGDALRRTLWRRGTRLVTAAGQPLRPADIVVGSVVTAWPDGIQHERSAVIVVRLGARGAQPPTNLEWVVDGTLVAYSKICTHAGCPVGLFRERDDALFCPCHQATFDAARAAEPTFGPAARRLPQLPLSVDAEGHLIALSDFGEQIGPGFGWLPRADEERSPSLAEGETA